MLRDHNGAFWTAVGHDFPSIIDPEATEILASKRGLEVAREINATTMHVELDSLGVVQAFEQSSQCLAAWGPWVQEIKTLLASFDDFKVLWVCRSANAAAQKLAKVEVGDGLCKVFESPKTGDCLEIDSFQVVVGNLWDSLQNDLETDKVCIDLSSPLPRFGGRFWVLADQVEEDDGADDGVGDAQLDKGDVADGGAGEAAKSADVEDRLGETVIRRRMQHDMRLSKKAVRPMSMVRPWIGPLPKVILPPATLSDFLLPDWQTVKKKHRKNRPFVRPSVRHDSDRLMRDSGSKSLLKPAVPRAIVPAMAAQTLRDFRAEFLHATLSAVGPDVASSLLGSAQAGYQAQAGVLLPDEGRISSQRVPCPAVFFRSRGCLGLAFLAWDQVGHRVFLLSTVLLPCQGGEHRRRSLRRARLALLGRKGSTREPARVQARVPGSLLLLLPSRRCLLRPWDRRRGMMLTSFSRVGGWAMTVFMRMVLASTEGPLRLEGVAAMPGRLLLAMAKGTRVLPGSLCRGRLSLRGAVSARSGEVAEVAGTLVLRCRLILLLGLIANSDRRLRLRRLLPLF
ncbi:WD repeat domain phosphoinositide-interacting protein 3 [Hordeum vulgare]|nr:WD repeat domain phosphoinositide-interacting protein 3 [Hordeum vulgare]